MRAGSHGAGQANRGAGLSEAPPPTPGSDVSGQRRCAPRGVASDLGLTEPAVGFWGAHPCRRLLPFLFLVLFSRVPGAPARGE